MNKILFFLFIFAISLTVIAGVNHIPQPPQPQPQPQPAPIPPGPVPPPIPPAPQPPAPVPGDKVEWLNWPSQQVLNANTPFLTDIVEHLPKYMGNQYFDNDRVTWGHETTHGINSHIRNTFTKNLYKGVGFYVGGDKAVVMSQPKMTLGQIAGVIPSNMRGSRYQLYFINQQSGWNDTPLYCFDEWVAYTNGAGVGLEIHTRTAEERARLASSDVMVAPLEFSIYAMYACIAIDKYDPNYLQTNTQFKEFVAHELRRSIGIYRKGILMPEYQWDTPLERNVRQNPECIAILRKMYGDALTMETLFGSQNTTNDLFARLDSVPHSSASWRWTDRLAHGYDVRDYLREDRCFCRYQPRLDSPLVGPSGGQQQAHHRP